MLPILQSHFLNHGEILASKSCFRFAHRDHMMLSERRTGGDYLSGICFVDRPMCPFVKHVLPKDWKKGSLPLAC